MSLELVGIFREGKSVEFSPGNTLFRTGDKVQEMFIVRTGRILLQRYTKPGEVLTLAMAREGENLAEASAYSNVYHCDAITSETSQVCVLPKDQFRTALSRDMNAAEAWPSMFARQVQELVCAPKYGYCRKFQIDLTPGSTLAMSRRK